MNLGGYVEGDLRQLADGSDRVVLTVRMTRAGDREWLDASGTVALVFREGGRWHGRRDASESTRSYDTEQDALDDVLMDPLMRLRDEVRPELSAP